MLIVGLTGGIASGKSTVTNMLREHLPVLDCDEIAHEQLQKVRLLGTHNPLPVPRRCII